MLNTRQVGSHSRIYGQQYKGNYLKHVSTGLTCHKQTRWTSKAQLIHPTHNFNNMPVKWVFLSPRTIVVSYWSAVSFNSLRPVHMHDFSSFPQTVAWRHLKQNAVKDTTFMTMSGAIFSAIWKARKRYEWSLGDFSEIHVASMSHMFWTCSSFTPILVRFSTCTNFQK